jgi:NAD-dependent SIR2 family protein deacetylase
METFKDDPRPFFRFAKNLFPGKIEPSPCHNFLAWLNKKSKLLRVYTQNIDGLEEQAGVEKAKVVYAHGSLLNATCMKCGTKCSARDIAGDVKAGVIPQCQRIKEKRAKARKESSAQLTDKPKSTRTLRKRSFQQYSEVDGYCAPTKEGVCGGIVKPDITFFGERLGNHVGLSLQNDWSKADALVVMGTSLSV